MKKIFLVAGELSGDRIAAWYLQRLRRAEGFVNAQAVGGDNLLFAGAFLYERFERLNVVGIIEIIKHLPRIVRILHRVGRHILDHTFEEVVLVDFPGFNLRLARYLKRRKPSLRITYVSPPQLWCWGAWRIAQLKKYVDHVVVMYPFEVEWYRARGVAATWIGSPVYDALQPYIEAPVPKEKMLVILPGSRSSEIRRMLPLMAEVAKRMLRDASHLRVSVCLAESLDTLWCDEQLKNVGLYHHERVQVVRTALERHEVMQKSSMALTKPGTVTLELALLNVASVVVFKISRVTYWLGRMFVTVNAMALPNLLLKKKLYPEFIQEACTVDNIYQEMSLLSRHVEKSDEYYQEIIEGCNTLRSMLSERNVIYDMQAPELLQQK